MKTNKALVFLSLMLVAMMASACSMNRVLPEAADEEAMMVEVRGAIADAVPGKTFDLGVDVTEGGGEDRGDGGGPLRDPGEGEDGRVDDDDVRHRDERRNAADDFAANRTAALVNLEHERIVGEMVSGIRCQVSGGCRLARQFP